jgi:RNA polymerase sigma-70 factor (ECF subfamily)
MEPSFPESDRNPSDSPIGPRHSKEDFIRALGRHERSLRAYVRGSLPRSFDVDEVMQEALIVAWNKFDHLDDLENFPKWLCVIARYEILSYRRKMARDRLVFSDEMVAILATEGLDENEAHVRRLELLDNCVAKLPTAKREIVLQAYAPDTVIGQLARQLGKTENAMYQLLVRIRQTLANCVEAGMRAD